MSQVTIGMLESVAYPTNPGYLRKSRLPALETSCDGEKVGTYHTTAP